jgi:hypothetical protein
MAPNTAQRRIQDPILQTVAHGYDGQEFAGSWLFPPVGVMTRGGRVVRYGREQFRKLALRRAPGAPKVRTTYEYGTTSFSIEQNALSTPLPIEHIEDALEVPGIDLGEAFTEMNMESLALQLEIEEGELARNPANYSAGNVLPLVGPAKFSSPACDVPLQIDLSKDVVRQKIKKKPNIMLASAKADIAIRNNPSVKDRFLHFTPELLSDQMLAALFGVQKYVVGDSSYDDDNGNSTDIWGTDVILAYVPKQSLILPSRYAAGKKLTTAMPSFAYNYVYKDSPSTDMPYWDEECDTWIFSAKYDCDPVLTGMDAGFLLQNVV